MAFFFSLCPGSFFSYLVSFFVPLHANATPFFLRCLPPILIETAFYLLTNIPFSGGYPLSFSFRSTVSQAIDCIAITFFFLLTCRTTGLKWAGHCRIPKNPVKCSAVLGEEEKRELTEEDKRKRRHQRFPCTPIA